MAIRLQGTAIDLAVWKPPARNRTDRHGEEAIEKLPTQRSMYMLNPTGHLVWVALHTGSGNRSPNDAFALQKLDEKQRKGFLPVARCPQTLGLESVLPAAVRGRAACSTGAKKDKGPISNDNPCKCLIETMNLRTDLNARQDAKNAERYKTQEQRDREQRERQIKALEDSKSK